MHVGQAARFVADRLRRAGFEEVEIVETERHPLVTRRMVSRARRADHRGLRALRRAAARPARQMAHAAIRADGPRKAASMRAAPPTTRARCSSPILAAEAFLKTARRAAGQRQDADRRRGGDRQPEFSAAPCRALKDRLACDLVVSADGAMWRVDLPSITVASRGMVALDVTVTGAAKDLHSGRHGGSAPNPIRALSACSPACTTPTAPSPSTGSMTARCRPTPPFSRRSVPRASTPARYFDEIGAPRPDPLPERRRPAGAAMAAADAGIQRHLRRLCRAGHEDRHPGLGVGEDHLPARRRPGPGPGRRRHRTPLPGAAADRLRADGIAARSRNARLRARPRRCRRSP